MRIYRVKRVRREWSDAERVLARRLFANGARNDDIAAALDRKPAAVRAWIHHNCRVWHEPEAVEYQQAAVPHTDIPRWYVLGWRFAGIIGGKYIFEWRSSGIARIPTATQRSENHLEIAA